MNFDPKIPPDNRRWRTRWRRFPGPLALAFWAMAFPVYWAVEGHDHQLANCFSALCVVLGVFAGLVWSTTRSYLPWAVKGTLLILPVLGLAIAGWLFEFRGFSGELIPQFRWRAKGKIAATPASGPRRVDDIEPGSATALPTAETESTTEAPSRTDGRFSQFMGNSRDGHVEGVELEENWEANPPREIWRRSVGKGWGGFAIDRQMAITLEEFEETDSILAVSLSDGRLLWRTPLARRHYHPMDSGGPTATPTILGDRVYVQSSTGIVACCELATGKRVWTVDLFEKGGVSQEEAEKWVTWGRSGSPLIVDDTLVVPFGGKPGEALASLIALDLETGAERWRGGEDQISYASPVLIEILGKRQIVSVNEGSVSGHDPSHGETLWRYAWPGHSNGDATVSQPVSVAPEYVLVSKGYGGGAMMLDFSKSLQRTYIVTTDWKNASLLKTKFTSCIHYKDYLYGLSDGILECVRAEDGKRMWKDSKKGRLGHGQMLRVGKHLLISSEDGRVVLGRADPERFIHLGEVQVLEGTTWNPLAVVDDCVLVRNQEEAVALRLPLVQPVEAEAKPRQP